MSKIRNKKRSSFARTLACLVGLFVLAATIVIAFCFSSQISAETIENGTEVRQNTELTYYLTAHYDGVDRNGVESDDTTMASLHSGFIEVTDTLPDGLDFVGFVTTENGMIGAVSRSDETVSCSGIVIDDTMEASVTEGTWNGNETEYTYHGLHYDATTRTVSFRVKNLRAGCDLTVGIVTRTPVLGSAKRKDFYNTAYIREGLRSEASNTVHTYMGSESETLYRVSYSYTGTVPDNAPEPPAYGDYASDTTVSVATSPSVRGYEFSGWTTVNATMSGNTFTMPTNSVNLTGFFTPTSEVEYEVSYIVNGDAPASFTLPRQKSYYADDGVEVSLPNIGDEIDGYIFEGWTSTDANITGQILFEMPEHDVEIVGSFRKKTYKLSYNFSSRGSLPANADELLPSEQYYPEGATVTLADNPSVEGYRFLGWYAEDTFTMPGNDVVIQGEWIQQNGVFEPEISMVISNPKTKYRIDNVVRFEISVTNTASYTIKNVQVLEEVEGVVFETGDGYQVLSDRFAQIPTITAGNTVTLYAEYSILEDVTAYHTNTVRIAGAIADNDYYLDTTNDYIATADFYTESWQDAPVLAGVKTNSTTLYAILIALGGLGIGACVVKVKRKR